MQLTASTGGHRRAGWKRAMRGVSELLMYVALSLAALPSAWVDVRNMLYFRTHPEMLAERDPALEVFAWIGFFPYVAVCFLTGCVPALYFLITGPRAVRVSIVVLAAAYAAFLVLTPRAPFTSFQRLHVDAVTSVVLCALPLACAAYRALRWTRP